ncbi:Uncharacterised protein [Candidatus Venteria ishoeyi]|uniref:Uncharacterized protein n=2 Tax=Candidatus Venteria ishoeyi TaxID=1899563 RepID=A0A1H6F2D7_9GAMM|nr:Uncharacterised protein [Candidatus Venteria ishoeyi]
MNAGMTGYFYSYGADATHIEKLVLFIKGLVFGLILPLGYMSLGGVIGAFIFSFIDRPFTGANFGGYLGLSCGHTYISFIYKGWSNVGKSKRK